MTVSVPRLFLAVPLVGLQCVVAVFPGYFKKEKKNRFVNSEWTTALVTMGLRYITTSKILALDSVVGRIRKFLCSHESFKTFSINNYTKTIKSNQLNPIKQKHK